MKYLSILFTLFLALSPLRVKGGDANPPRLTREQQVELKQLSVQLAQAQLKEDEAQVNALAAQGVKILGEAAGQPETPEVFRPVPPGATLLSAAEAREAFTPYLQLIAKEKWWTIGLDPTKTPHLPRELASIIGGCLAARRAGSPQGERLLATAREAGDYLLWTQAQGGRGVIPFPALRGGGNKAFAAAEKMMQRAEQSGQLEQLSHNGWMIDDLGDGGLQFDNGLCGVALLELYEAANDAKYLAAARAAADWAAARAVVPNWNYNSFSVYLLARIYGVTGDKKYLDSARKKARLGVYPGQLREGPRAGRWSDPHNASLPYHYIIVRALAELLRVMPAADPDRPQTLAVLKLALKTRNADIVRQGAATTDYAMESLVLISNLSPALRAEFKDCGVESALAVLERYCGASYRARRPPLAPGAWGRYLELVANRR